MPDIERMNFPDGTWWEIKTVVTRGMRKAFRRAGQRIALAAIAQPGVDVLDEQARVKAILANADKLDLDAVDDAYLLEGSAAWSRAEPISKEAIDAIPDGIVAQVLVRMRVLYAATPAETLKN